MEEIYLVIIEDRHTDVMVYPFTNPDIAVAYARKKAKSLCRHVDDYEEHDYGNDEGWLFYANYSCESDSVRVVTAEINKHLD